MMVYMIETMKNLVANGMHKWRGLEGKKRFNPTPDVVFADSIRFNKTTFSSTFQ